MFVCEKCGGTVHIGDFPFCRGSSADHGAWTGAEEPCAEFVIEHMASDPMTFTSRRKWVREMDKRGFEPTKFRDAPPRGLIFDMGKR